MTNINPVTGPRLSTPSGVGRIDLSGPPFEAAVPLAILESVRSLDLPDSDLETELVHELRNKRFGLSDTVYMQIKRYAESVRREQLVPYEEVLALSRLVGRRPDADIVFREAGRRVARAALGTISTAGIKSSRSLPGAVGRPLALRYLKSLSKRYLRCSIQRQGSNLLFDVAASVTADSVAGGVGCSFYDAAFREMLLELTGLEHVLVPVACITRGGDSCQWRADWRR